MLDLNKTLYTLKKMIKSSDTATLNKQDASKSLRQIISYAKENKLKAVEKLCWKAISKMGFRAPAYTMIHDLEEIQHQLLYVKEKKQVMNRRETAARSYFYHTMSTSNLEHYDVAVYDIVKVPTQGGLHQSVVTKIGKNHIECWPITTASPEELMLIGCKYYPLGQKSEDGRPLYLTNSMTKIPYNMAARSYVRSYDDPATINAAINMFKY